MPTPASAPPSPSSRRELAWLFALALLVRAALLVARGAYLGHDEGYYLLLGRNLWHGHGYALTDVPHIALSPLFPVLAGAVMRLGVAPVLAGRLVAALASAALVWPVWVLGTRWWGRAVGRWAALLIAVCPALLAFVPVYSGRELYQGASEPLFHLALWSTLALVGRTWRRALVAGTLMALAVLGRPEAMVAALLVGAWVCWPTERWTGRTIAHGVGRGLAYGLVFALVVSPWVWYLHGVTGQWGITGRGGPVAAATPRGAHASRPSSVKPAGKTATASPTASADATPTQDAVADDLLWGGSEWYYIQANYTLDASAMRFRSNYWGVAPIPVAPGRPSWTPLPPPEARDSAVHAAMTAHRQQVHPTRAALYGRTLWLLVPAGWWVFILLGLSQAMRHWRTRTSLEALAAVVTVGTSVAVVVLVYVDPRNHLLLLPWLAVYAAVGLVHADRWWTHRRSAIRGSVAVSPIVLVAGLVVVGIPAGQLVRQWWLAETVGSLPDVAATAMRMSGEELRAHTAPDTPIMSWHPGFALYADRPWRVLPYEPMPVVSRYALAHGKPVIVLATFHHSPIDIRGLAAVLALRLDPRLTGQDSIVRVQLGPDANPLRWGTLAPDSTAAHP